MSSVNKFWEAFCILPDIGGIDQQMLRNFMCSGWHGAHIEMHFLNSLERNVFGQHKCVWTSLVWYGFREKFRCMGHGWDTYIFCPHWHRMRLPREMLRYISCSLCHGRGLVYRSWDISGVWWVWTTLVEMLFVYSLERNVFGHYLLRCILWPRWNQLSLTEIFVLAGMETYFVSSLVLDGFVQ